MQWHVFATQTPNITHLGHVIVFPTAFAGRHALRDSRPLCCGVTTRCIIAPLPYRYIMVPSYFEYLLQICQPRMRRLALSREFHHPQPTHRTACDSLSPQYMLGTDLRVQMTIPLQTREEGRLTSLRRASTRTLAGQTTPITTTVSRPPRERWEEARGGRRPRSTMEDPSPDDAEGRRR